VIARAPPGASPSSHGLDPVIWLTAPKAGYADFAPTMRDRYVFSNTCSSGSIT